MYAMSREIVLIWMK